MEDLGTNDLLDATEVEQAMVEIDGSHREYGDGFCEDLAVDAEIVYDVAQFRWKTEERERLTNTTLLIPRKEWTIAVEVDERLREDGLYHC